MVARTPGREQGKPVRLDGQRKGGHATDSYMRILQHSQV
ncbi:hypothetical protein RR42_m1041 [Cupriavidus basilensis]|uniref:Uncharacterized protein n=1 Tax=Cupriavidus basilensis TaxID=68895 RepID=A0A0C4Y8A3_9BURK|nr:hypothetical protein RR42_m1041 [Cupriavidus basilensis]